MESNFRVTVASLSFLFSPLPFFPFPFIVLIDLNISSDVCPSSMNEPHPPLLLTRSEARPGPFTSLRKLRVPSVNCVRSHDLFYSNKLYALIKSVTEVNTV